jgi:hypothetical protein
VHSGNAHVAQKWELALAATPGKAGDGQVVLVSLAAYLRTLNRNGEGGVHRLIDVDALGMPEHHATDDECVPQLVDSRAILSAAVVPVRSLSADRMGPHRYRVFRFGIPSQKPSFLRAKPLMHIS